ncbi:MAG: pyridoxal phosphate-dependent aminotransferase [Proteobacteria bacterium]|jgi:aspartate/methionine/tyrosine aminotransferase|nr:pyridoxal phosphate-dependent aminotransferase [Pseudomonadota bacterium]
MYFTHSRTPSLEGLEENACHASWAAFCQRAATTGEIGYDLTGSNPTRVGLPQVEAEPDAIAHALNAAYTASPQGIQETRRAIADIYQNQTTPERIQLFASTSEAVGALVKLFCAPGDEIITCSPTYPLLDCLCSLECVTLREIPLQDCAGEWAIDFWALEQACTPQTRAIIVVSPNNPTGHCIRCDELKCLIEFCAKRHIVLVIDEVFASYRLNDNPELVSEPAAAMADRGIVISLSGLSKVCGQPQHKLGWAVFGGDPELVSEAMSRLTYITDSTLSVSGWVQRMAPQFLAKRHDFRAPCLARMRQNYAYLQACAQRPDVQWRLDPIDGGWSACIRLPGWADDDQIAQKLAQNGVRVFPGLFFGYRANHPTLVVSLITPPESFAAGIERMTTLLTQML